LQYRSCKACGSWFELSPGVVRKSRLFCSDACKSMDYRDKQNQARQLYADKKTFRQIARELGSEVAVVKGWIRGRKP
jgi:hypothetical protein